MNWSIPWIVAVGVEHAAGAGAGAHADHPFRLGHLLIDVLQDRHHFDGDAAGDDHQIALPGAESHRLGSETGEIVADEAVAISSMPQQAVAKGIGHSELRRAQLTTFLSWVVRTLSGS